MPLTILFSTLNNSPFIISFLNVSPQLNTINPSTWISHGNENTDLCAYKQALIVHFRVRNNNKVCIIYGLMFSSLLTSLILVWIKQFQVISSAKE